MIKFTIGVLLSELDLLDLLDVSTEYLPAKFKLSRGYVNVKQRFVISWS